MTFLRRSLQLDGIASGLTGVLLIVAAGPIAPLFGIRTTGVMRLVGALLVVFAAALLWNASRPRISRAEVITAVVLNIGWVVGSAVLIVDGPLTVIGNLTVAAVAAAVLLFAVLEIIGLRRAQPATA